MLKFSYTILYVKNVLETVAFYENAFGFKRRFVTEDGNYGELISESVTLSFVSVELAKSNLPGGFMAVNIADQPFGIEIGFTTNDVAGIMEKATQFGAIVVAEPKTKPWGQVVGYLRDINGFLIEICTPMQ